MESVTINGKEADITLESEKTLGDLLRGFDLWLRESGRFLSGVEIDGAAYGSAALDAELDRELATISRVGLKTATRAELLLEALLGIQNDLEYLQTENSGGRRAEDWEKSHAAVFLKENAADLYELSLRVLEGKLAPAAAGSVIQERIRELQNPSSEIRSSIPLIEEISKRLEDLPLDVQTGRDARAAETIALFSAVTEKLLRILLFIGEGTSAENISSFLDEFGAAVRELHAAYENRDTVLVGDLAEYELAPRLRELPLRLGEFVRGELPE